MIPFILQVYIEIFADSVLFENRDEVWGADAWKASLS